MAKTAQEFIQSSFSPTIATLCSSKVDTIMSKNNLTLCELLQPFTTMDWEGQFREPGGSVCIVKNLKIIIRDVNWKPVQPTEARRQLNNAVLHNYDDKTVPREIEGHNFDVPQATPWFDAWMEAYFEVQFPSDHEFTKHFLSCIIVATTQDDNIIDTYNALNQQYAQYQNVSPPKLPKWFNSSVLKSYLLLHDVTAVPKDKADAAFETLKQTFGAGNCFMLAINSKSSSDPKLPVDYWAQYVNRTMETNSEMSSSLTNLSTPPESQATFPPSNLVTPEERQTISGTPGTQETLHPLTTSENDIYDNANSLQTYSFSGSSESVNVTGKALDSSMEIHGASLNMTDIESIKTFLLEYVSKAFLPYLEKQISQLSEVVANKKGVSRSLLSATKRWFTTGKAGNTTASNTVIYSTDCPELQLRRLGDLWFLCGQWQRAFDTYHTAKREFYADSAWLCYAGALEMAAISAFMVGEATRKTYGYMEESITTYLNTCRMVQYAVRATLLSALCLTNTGLYGEAAKQLIRMTSEDSDLRSAMLLEQAALCFLSGPGTKAMCRKYAFHMVLAGHRFSKAGQKKHAYRCYKQAHQVYADSGWRLSTDHVSFALGRLAGALRLPGAAARWLAAPLAPASPQSAPQQDAFLREYMLAHQQWIESSEEFKECLPVLPVPLLATEDIAVLCVGPAPLSSPGRTPATSVSLPDTSANALQHEDAYWHKLEEVLLHVAQGSTPMIFKPTFDLYTEKTDSNPIVPQGEPIQISITLHNPLKVSLLLKDIELLWQFLPDTEDVSNEDVLNNEPLLAAGQNLESNVIHRKKIKSLLFEGDVKKNLIFTVTPLKIGQLHIQGLAFKLSNAGEGKEKENGVMISGKLNLQTGIKGVDKRLQIIVIPYAPCLQMTFSETCVDVMSGELKTIDVEFRNVGPVEMSNLHLALSHPEFMSLVKSDEVTDDFRVLYEDKYREPPVYADERAARAAARGASAARRARLVATSLTGGANARARLLLHPHARAPRLYLLAYYDTGVRARPYRLLRHVFRFKAAETIEIAVTPRRSLSTVGQDVTETMRLAVEVKNVCNEKENISLEVLEASLLSRQWKLIDLTAALNRDDSLSTHERIHFIFKAKRILEDLPDGRVEYSCLKVDKAHPESVDDVNVPPYSKFITDYVPSVLDTVEPISNKKKQGLTQSMFILRWKTYDKTSGKTAIGQHCLWLENFTKVLSREREQVTEPLPGLDESLIKVDLNDTKNIKEKDDVVIFKMEHSSNINHDFKTRKLCIIPIIINIVNCNAVPVTVFINMTNQQNRESSGELGWTGALKVGFDENNKELGLNVPLEKFGSRRVQVGALCAAPGTYVIGSAFSVSTISTTDNHLSKQLIKNTSLLVVKNHP